MRGQLVYNPETERYELNGIGLRCGLCLRVLIVKDDEPQWVETRIEMAQDWFLIGLKGYQINGLFAEIE